MLGNGPKQYPSVLCHKRTKVNERRAVSKDTRTILNRCFSIESTDGEVIFNKCRHKCSSILEYMSLELPLPLFSSLIQSPDWKERATNVHSPPSVSLPIQSITKSHADCVFCRKLRPMLIVVPTEAGFKMYICHNLFIPAGS